jgi:hypothetical protein
VEAIPDFVTHYYRHGQAPFLNLSDLDEEQLALALGTLDAAAASGTSSRRFGRRYMALRRATEAKLRDLFVARGGRPERAHPHYFVLGQSPWFQGLYSEPREFTLPISALPPQATCFTYPDSIAAMSLGAEYGLELFPQPYHDQVFLLDELEEIVARYGLPRAEQPDSYEGHQHRPFEHYLEFQLWMDPPLPARLTR